MKKPTNKNVLPIIVAVRDIAAAKYENPRSLSEKSGVCASGIRYMFNGGKIPTVKNFQRVMAALGLELAIHEKRKGVK